MSYNVDSVTPYWFLAGVVSYGPRDCGTAGFPGVYSKVADFLQWISSSIRD